MASPTTAATSSYPLTRTYTVASLVGIVAVTALLAMFYRQNAVDQLHTIETDSRVAAATCGLSGWTPDAACPAGVLVSERRC
jgi:hypothetical protein